MLRHRHKLLGFRTSVMNQLHALAMGQGLCWGKKLWTMLGRQEQEDLGLDPWASQRWRGLLELLDQLNPWIEGLDQAVQKEAAGCPEAVLLIKQKGVGPVTALAFVLTLGLVNRFRNSKQVVSYLGLNPSEASSGDKTPAGWDQQSRQHDDARRNFNRGYSRRNSESNREAVWAAALTASLHQQFPLPAPVRIGTGINTGLSMMVKTDAKDNPEFSPLGDNVNAAFRLETATKGFGLLSAKLPSNALMVHRSLSSISKNARSS